MKISHRDILVLIDDATSEYKEIPGESFLPDMNRALTEGERRAIAFFKASILQLSRMGALKEDFVKDSELPLFHPDSEPSTE